MSASAAQPDYADPGKSPFRKRNLLILVGIGAGSLVVALIGSLFAEPVSGTSSADTTSFSRSALGYHALATWLEDSGVPVVRSRSDSPARVSEGSVLLLAEPPPGEDEPEAEPMPSMIRRALERGAAVVVVLPKWRPVLSEPGPDGAVWVKFVTRRERYEIAAVLSDVSPRGATGSSILRYSSLDEEGDGHFPAPTLARPQLIDAEDVGLRPVFGRPDAALIAQDPASSLFVISDPDLLNTHGLGQGDNAAIVHQLLIEDLGATSVVIDETLHGFIREASIWRELARPPLALLTAHVGVLLLLLLWAALGRFGKPMPLAPRLAPGKRALVEHTADLLGAGGHHAYTLTHYYRLTLRETARACALPSGLGDLELATRLDALARERGVSVDLLEAGRRVQSLNQAKGWLTRRKVARDTLAISRDLHRFRQEMIDGAR